MQPDKSKIEKSSKELFSCLLENELSEAEAVASIIMALTMRLSYASKDLPELEGKLDRFPHLFELYARANLSNAQSAILAKQELIKGSH